MKWLNKFKRTPNNHSQLIELLRKTEQSGIIDHDSLSIIESTLQIAQMQVRDIMFPRSQMSVLRENQSLQDILTIVIQSGHSRFPVVSEDDPGEVLGILLAKDLLPYFSEKTNHDFDLEDILRPATFVPESKRLNILLREFRKTHQHMAIVVDEYGSMAGIVTIEDVLEQIVGEIEDEYDINEEDYIKKLSETEYTIKALTPIEDFNEYFNVHFSDEDFDTIGGLITQQVNHVPKRNETITIEDFQFTVLNADKRRIRLLSLVIPTKAHNSSEK